MAEALLLALGAAVYPQLLAVVVVILTRPHPRPLLWACYLGSLSASLAAGIVIFAVFRSRETILGASSERLSPATYLVIGGIAVLLSLAVATRRGRELMGSDLPGLRRGKEREPIGSRPSGMWSRAERALRDGSLSVAVVAGVMLAAPGPFDLLAVGHLARGGYELLVAAATILACALIKFLLIEVPIVSYAIDPGGTSVKVSRFAGWMQTNKISLTAAVIAVVGLVFIGRGITGLT